VVEDHDPPPARPWKRVKRVDPREEWLRRFAGMPLEDLPVDDALESFTRTLEGLSSGVQ
jgi:hypothetical protein